MDDITYGKELKKKKKKEKKYLGEIPKEHYHAEVGWD